MQGQTCLWLFTQRFATSFEAQHSAESLIRPAQLILLCLSARLLKLSGAVLIPANLPQLKAPKTWESAVGRSLCQEF